MRGRLLSAGRAQESRLAELLDDYAAGDPDKPRSWRRSGRLRPTWLRTRHRRRAARPPRRGRHTPGRLGAPDPTVQGRRSRPHPHPATARAHRTLGVAARRRRLPRCGIGRSAPHKSWCPTHTRDECETTRRSLRWRHQPDTGQQRPDRSSPAQPRRRPITERSRPHHRRPGRCSYDQAHVHACLLAACDCVC